MISPNDNVCMRASPRNHLIRIWAIAHYVSEAEDCMIAPIRGIVQNGIQGFPVSVNVTQYQETQNGSRLLGYLAPMKVFACSSGKSEAAGTLWELSTMASATRCIPLPEYDVQDPNLRPSRPSWPV